MYVRSKNNKRGGEAMVTFILLLAAFLWLIIFGIGFLFACGFWIIDVVIGIALIGWLCKAIFGKKK